MDEQLTSFRLGWTRRLLLKGAAALALSTASLAQPWAWTTVARASQRPISDFLDAQGTTNVFFFPPVRDFVGWFKPVSPVPLANVDYPGHADAYLGGILGTSFSGKVTERPLNHGRAEVLVILHTHNALSWVINTKDFSFVDIEPMFGHDPFEVELGAEPALGDSHLQWKFVNTAPGSTLPDFVTATFPFAGSPPEGFEQISVSFRASASGPLRAGSGWPDGTPGHLTVSQTCNGATADACPAELVELQAVGQ